MREINLKDRTVWINPELIAMVWNSKPEEADGLAVIRMADGSEWETNEYYDEFVSDVLGLKSSFEEQVESAIELASHKKRIHEEVAKIRPELIPYL